MRTPLVLLLLLSVTACSEPQRDLQYRPFDAGSEADAPYFGADGGDGELGKPCRDDKQCDDGIGCTFDSCDLALERCRNHSDDTLCQDDVYCNGRELCFQKTGCAQGAVVTCEGGSAACLINRCIEATKSCAHDPRDVDQDGDADDHCMGGHDCDEQDPAINSLHSEVCANGRDDNCNGAVDEKPCAAAESATCGTAKKITAPGNYALSTVGAGKSFQTTCSVTSPQAAHDVVAQVTVPAGPGADLDVWVSTGGTGGVAVAVQGACGQSGSELSCGAGPGATETRTRARGLMPGTYWIVVTAASETTVTLGVDFLPPSPKAMNEDCGAPEPITAGVPMKVSLIDPAKDLPGNCGVAAGELTYALTVAQTSDVRVFASTLRGSGAPIVGLRAPSCSGQNDELHCHAGAALPVFARALPPGTYVLTVAATSPIDALVLVQLSAPTVAPSDQSCVGAPSLTIGKTLTFDLSNHEDAVKDGCLPGSPTAAYAVTLTDPSDVLVVGRFPQNDIGAVSFDAPACGPGDLLMCASGTTPVRTAKRNVASGSYRAVVADSLGQQGTLGVFVRPTVASTLVFGGHDCATATLISERGGLFTGDTTLATGTYDESCDSAGQPKGGAPDHVFRLDLTKPSHVVLSMQGSVYSTILSVRQGLACPGIELKNGCTAGFAGPRSFLDFAQLGAGTYWVFVDGYAGARGVYALDVYITDP